MLRDVYLREWCGRTVASSPLETVRRNATGHRGIIGRLHQSRVRTVSCLRLCVCVLALRSPWTITLWGCVYPLASASCPAQSQRLFTQHWQASAKAATRDRTAALQLPLSPEPPHPKHTHLWTSERVESKVQVNGTSRDQRPHMRCFNYGYRQFPTKNRNLEIRWVLLRWTLVLFSFRLIIPLIQLISALLTHR